MESLCVFKTDKGYMKGDMHQGVEFVDSADDARVFTGAEVMLYASSIAQDLWQFYDIKDLAVEIINWEDVKNGMV